MDYSSRISPNSGIVTLNMLNACGLLSGAAVTWLAGDSDVSKNCGLYPVSIVEHGTLDMLNACSFFPGYFKMLGMYARIGDLHSVLRSILDHSEWSSPPESGPRFHRR